MEPIASRRVRTGREWDISKPPTVSALGEITKKAGFHRLSGEELSEIVYDDTM